MLIFGNQAMKKATLAALAMSLSAATLTHAEKPTAPRTRTELIINLAVITASVDRCHFEIDSRIIGLDLLKGRCHVVESLMRVRRVSQLKSCGGDDFAPRLHG
jgi:hypothetical protein